MIDVTMVVFRMAVVAAFAFAVWQVYLYSRKNVGGFTHVFLKFMFFAYSITYFAGLSIIFVTDGTVLQSYFGGSMHVPGTISYWTVWLMGAAPYAVYALIAVLPPFVLGAARDEAVQGGDKTSSFPAAIVTALMVFGAAIAVLWPNILPLLSNAMSLAGGISGFGQLYEMRQAVFSDMGLIETGFLYGSLPALCAGLLFYDGPQRVLVRLAAVPIGAMTLLLNLGMFQIAPISACILIVIFLHVHLDRSQLRLIKRVGLFIAVLMGYSAYSLLKGIGAGFQQFSVALEVLLRMPSATPYLFEMKQVSDAPLSHGASLANELGYYMFPGLDLFEGFLAMPQPGFLAVWFHNGLAYSLIALLLVLMVPSWLARIFVTNTRMRFDFMGVGIIYVIAHYVYYAFQTTFFELLISSYSVLFPMVPIVCYAFAKALVSKSRVAT